MLVMLGMMGALGAVAVGARPAGETRYASPHLALTLPAGWRVKWTQPEPTQELATGLPGTKALLAEGPAGWSLELWFACPLTEMGADQMWELKSDASRRRVATVVDRGFACSLALKKECLARAGGRSEEAFWCDLCTAGDGKFLAIAVFDGVSPWRTGSAPCFDVSNSKTETPDLAVIRKVLLSFEVVGEVEREAPTLPGWDEARAPGAPSYGPPGK